MCNGVVVTRVADCGEIAVGYVGLLLAVGNLKPTSVIIFAAMKT
jgi:hypothetical protein